MGRGGDGIGGGECRALFSSCSILEVWVRAGRLVGRMYAYIVLRPSLDLFSVATSLHFFLLLALMYTVTDHLLSFTHLF